MTHAHSAPPTDALFWFRIPCDPDTFYRRRIDESPDGEALGSWLMAEDGPRCMAFRLGLPFGAFCPDRRRPTRSPDAFQKELHAAFGWQLDGCGQAANEPVYRAALAPVDDQPLVRLRDPVLGKLREVLGSLQERGICVGLEVLLSWDCCSADLAQACRKSLGHLLRSRRPRREVLRLLRVWVDAVRLRVSLHLIGPADPGRLVAARIGQALRHDLMEPFTVVPPSRASAPATPDLLFGLLSLCSLSEGTEAEEDRVDEALDQLLSSSGNLRSR